MNLLDHAILRIVYLFYLAMIGMPFLFLADPQKWWKRNFAAWFPLAFFLGIMALTVVAFLFSIMDVRTGVWMPLVVMVSGYGAAFGRYRRMIRAPISVPQVHERPWRAYEILFAGGCAGLLAMNLVMTAAYPQFDMDMMTHILIKGKVLTDSTYATAVYLHDPVFGGMHCNYPPLPVFLHCFMFLFGATSMVDYYALNYLILLMIGLSLHNALREHIPVWQSLLWTFIFLSTGEYLRNQFIISSTDILLSLAVLLIGLNFLDGQTPGRQQNRVLLALLCAGALLTKLDAIVFITALSLIVWHKDWRSSGKYFLIMALIVGPWAVYRWFLPNIGNETGERLLIRWQSLVSFPTWSLALKTEGFILWEYWNRLFLFLPFLWILLSKKPCLRAPLLACYVAIVAYGLFIWGIVPVVPSYPQTFLRLLTHFYPSIVLMVALGLNTSLSSASRKTEIPCGF